MTGFWVMISVVVALCFFGYIFAPKAWRKLREAGSAQVNKAGDALWNKDLPAVLQQRIDHSADEIREASKGLQQYNALRMSVQRQVETGLKTCANLEALAKRYIQQGDEGKAGEYAMQLNAEKDHLETNQRQLTTYESGYQNNLRKIKAARDKITEARQNADRLKAELNMSRAEAEIADLAQKFNIRGANLEGLGEVEQAMQRQIDQNRSKAQVMADISADGMADLEAEEAVKKEQAKATLEEFKAKMGMDALNPR